MKSPAIRQARSPSASTRRSFLRALALSLPLGWLGSAFPTTSSATERSRASTRSGSRRNILLIIADDQGRDLGVYGNPVIRTPNIDRLAARGTLFTHAFSNVSSCSPSRAVLYTGLYAHSNGMYGLAHDVHNQHLLPGVRTFSQLLKEAGYLTALVGKKHVLPDEALPFDAELAPEQPGNRDVAFTVGEARRFMSEAGAQPFAIVAAFSDPHRAAENFGNTRDWPSVERVRYDPRKVTVPAHLPDFPEVREDLAQYYESISRLDSAVGMLLGALADTGHAEDTLIVYLSDNGRPFPGAKTNLYDDAIHLPLIIAAPGRRAGVRNDAMVSWVDILPTLLDWSAAPSPPYDLPGRSLLPILDESSPKGWDRVYASHGFHEIHQYYPMRALRTRRYKYIVNLAAGLSYPIAGDVESSPSWRAIASDPKARLGARTLDAYLHRPAEELYALNSDPHEVVNLAGERAARETLAQLRSELEKFRIETRDPWLPGQFSPFGH